MDWDGLKIHLHIFDEQRKHIEFINVGGSDTRLRKPDLQTSTGSSPDEGRHGRLSHGPVGWCQSGMEEILIQSYQSYGYGSIPIDTFLVGWTSIYQLFWGSLGTRVLTHPHI